MVKVYSIDGIVPVVAPTAFVHPTAILIGDVIIGAGCYIGPAASLRGDMGRITVGPGSNIQDHCLVHCFPGAETAIGENGHVGHGAVLHGCTVKENALIGMNSVVMDKAVIGVSAFVAAMAFVRTGFEVPDRHLAAGIPAKVVRELKDDEIAWKSKGTAEYQGLAQRSLATLEATDSLDEIEENRPTIQMTPHLPLNESRGKG